MGGLQHFSSKIGGISAGPGFAVGRIAAGDCCGRGLAAAGEFAVVQLLEFPDQEKSALDLDFLLFVD